MNEYSEYAFDNTITTGRSMLNSVKSEHRVLE